MDLEIALRSADRVLSLLKSRENIHGYVVAKMKELAPNLSSLIGEIIGARLISSAGSLPKLAEFPPSSLLNLGAETAPSR